MPTAPDTPTMVPGVVAWTQNASADASDCLIAADRFRATARTWARSQQALVMLAAGIDDSGCWLAEGHTTPASWIAQAAEVETCTAREWLRISHAIQRLPHTKAAFEQDELSYAKVRALTRVATPDNEAELLLVAFEWPANQLACALAVWMRDNSDPEALDRHHSKQRSYSMRIDPDGMQRVSIALRPETGGTLQAAVEAGVMRTTPRQDENGSWPSLSAQYADAFAELIESRVQRQVELVVHVNAEGGSFDDGTPLTDTATGRLIDGAFMRALIHDDARTPIDATNRRCHPTDRQKRVVAARDGGCVDCGSNRLINFDHQPPHARTGHTITTELEQRCAPCHHRKTERG